MAGSKPTEKSIEKMKPVREQAVSTNPQWCLDDANRMLGWQHDWRSRSFSAVIPRSELCNRRCCQERGLGDGAT